MATPSRVRIPGASVLLCLVLAACSTTAGTDVGSPSPAVADCGVTLASAETEGGFLGMEIPAPSAGVVVEAALAIGGEGPMLTGRPIAWSGRLTGSVSTFATTAGAEIAIEADTGGDATASCGGLIRIVLPGPIGGDWHKGEASVAATIGGAEIVDSSGFGCTALDQGAGTVGVECSVVSVRNGDRVEAGTLWLRLRTSGQAPTMAAALPDWAVAMATEGPTPIQTDPPTAGPISGTIALGAGAPVAITPTGGHVRILPVDGAIRYEALLAFGPAEGPGARVLSVELDGFTPEATFAGTRVQLLEFQPSGMGRGFGVVRESRDCPVTVTDGGRSGSIACSLAPMKLGDADSATKVSATWRVAAVPDLRGRPVTVSWTLGDHYVSSGKAVTWPDPLREEIDGLYVVPDIRTGGDPITPEMLRIVIRGYAGDGIYTGDGVEASLHNVLARSPRIASSGIILAAAHIETAVSTDPDSDAWYAIFGPCTATISEGRSRGSITCEADPEHRVLRGAGSTTLVATWSPAP